MKGNGTCFFTTIGMSLSEYKKKRSFNETPEPEGKVHKATSTLRFVVQKHAASHLHYDFRLEMEGVLKSWAVPKGPSMNPKDKRLAMMVEDHPFEYRTFEGIIPAGNYGAGTVIVWDEGTYQPVDKSGKKISEKELLHQLHKGNFHFIMKGKKLRGEFTLVHIQRDNMENGWLLMKIKDDYASTEDITKKDKSVQSNMTLEQVAKNSDRKWISNRKSKDGKSKISDQEVQDVAQVEEIDTKALINKKGTKASRPTKVKPMLATLTDGPFDDPEWVYEIKFDGYRAIADLNKGKADLYSRNLLSFNTKFKPIFEALQNWKVNAVVDGEIIALNDKGKIDFQQLQAFQKTGEGTLIYYVFDILWLDGKDLRELPLLERKEILQQIMPENEAIRYSDHVEEKGTEFFKLAEEEGLEGIMAKRSDSTYLANNRSSSWLKIKTSMRQEAIICGFTKGRGSRKYFGSLVLGIYENKELKFIGQTGSGFDEKLLSSIYKELEKRIIDECPFKTKPKTTQPATWIKPELICEVKFQEWTREGSMRHPIFQGIREDKKAKEVGREEVKKQQEVPGQVKELNASLLFDESAKKQEIEMDGKLITFTNLSKLYWKKENISKGDMLNYYNRICDFMLPYMKDRPQSLNRTPDGVGGKSFYQKNVEGKVPDWVVTHEYVSDSDGEAKQFYVCTDRASLLYIANMGCIEMNPWNSRVQSPDNPDWCVIDLDPGKISFEKVIEAANVVKEVLDALEIPSYPKTSGSTGIHIYIPLGAKYTYDQSRQLAELVVTLVHDQIPKFTSLERSPAKRPTKIYLDYLQNRQIQTIAAPYSLRPKPGATVSTPLHWEEVKKGLKIADFNIHNIFDRLKETGDIFTPVLGEGIDMQATLEKAAGFLSDKK
jgi:bifunctional non-homologous end joining protein LigD